MSIPFLNNVDFNNNELQNVRLQSLAVAPVNSGEGQIYFNSAENRAKVFENGEWRNLTSEEAKSWQVEIDQAKADTLRDAKAYTDEKVADIDVDYKTGFKTVLDENDATINDKIKEIAGLTVEEQNGLVNRAIDGAKEKVDELRSDLMGGAAAEDLDTFLELGEKVKEHGDLISALQQLPKSYIQLNVGDGVATSNVINHNLGVRFVDVAIFTKAGERVHASYTCTDDNNVTIYTGASALNGHIVRVLG